MKLAKLAVATTLAAACVWVGLIDSAQAGRRRGGSGSNLFDKLPNPDPNAEVEFIFDDSIMDTKNTSDTEGEFLGAIQGFSYLRPGTNDPFFDDGSKTFFFNDSGDVRASLSGNFLNYSIIVNSTDSSTLTYDFQYELTNIKSALLPGISDAAIRSDLVNSLDSFFNLVIPAGSTTARLPNSTTPCKLFAPCKFFNKDFYNPSGEKDLAKLQNDFQNRFKNIDSNNLSDFLQDGGDPGSLEIRGEIADVETVPEPGTMVGIMAIAGAAGLGLKRHQKKETA